MPVVSEFSIVLLRRQMRRHAPFFDAACLMGDEFVPRATFLVGVCVVAKIAIISLNFFSSLSLIIFMSIRTAKISADKFGNGASDGANAFVHSLLLRRKCFSLIVYFFHPLLH
jgi:hypothetical protein